MIWWKMKRILSDTNIYELILKEFEIEQLRKAKEKRPVIFYGVDIIRKELRSIPKGRRETVRNELVKLRNALLSIYDILVDNHVYKTDTKTSRIAEDYYIAYAVLKGKAPKDEIINDFKIVATASLHNIDILVSEDNKTMLAEKSLKAYNSVNDVHKLRSPNFIGCQKPLIKDECHAVKQAENTVVFDAQNSTNHAVFEHTKSPLNYSSQTSGILLFQEFKKLIGGMNLD